MAKVVTSFGNATLVQSDQYVTVAYFPRRVRPGEEINTLGTNPAARWFTRDEAAKAAKWLQVYATGGVEEVVRQFGPPPEPEWTEVVFTPCATLAARRVGVRAEIRLPDGTVLGGPADEIQHSLSCLAHLAEFVVNKGRGIGSVSAQVAGMTVKLQAYGPGAVRFHLPLDGTINLDRLQDSLALLAKALQ